MLCMSCILKGHYCKPRQSQDLFGWGGGWQKERFEFTGTHISKFAPDKVKLSQSSFITDGFYITPVSDHKDDTFIKDIPAMTIQYRSGEDGLQWTSGQFRPDVSADTSPRQMSMEAVLIKQTKEINDMIIHYLKATLTAGITIQKLPLDRLLIAPYGNASFQNAPSGNSLLGLLMAFTTVTASTEPQPAPVLDYKTNEAERTGRSTLTVETNATDAEVDHGNDLNSFPSEFLEHSSKTKTTSEGLIPVIPAADCESWVPTKTFKRADGLTKRDAKTGNILLPEDPPDDPTVYKLKQLDMLKRRFSRR